jgi:hypothetical protein
MTTPWLTDAEIDELCDPLTQPAAMVRFLNREYKLTVTRKHNGRPLVMREHFDAVMGGLPADKRKRARPEQHQLRQPDAAGLVLAFQRRG